VDLKTASLNLAAYVPPIARTQYARITVISLGIGLLLMAWFFIYETTTKKKNRSLTQEVLMGIVSSVFMGVGTLFLLLWLGIFF